MARLEAGPLAGWKLGVTSRAKQAQVGVHEPVRGYLAADDALDVGEPGDRVQLRLRGGEDADPAVGGQAAG